MSWDSAEKRLNEGPKQAGWFIFKWIMVLIVAFTVLGIFGRAVGWFGRTAAVVAQEFDPRVMLNRYMWFKDAAAQLDKLDADIRVYDQRGKSLADQYDGVPRSQWPRDDRQEASLISAEVAGVKAGYNSLAAQYNANMAKFNYAFTNAGSLPVGADRVLPREFRSYEVK